MLRFPDAQLKEQSGGEFILKPFSQDAYMVSDRSETYRCPV